MSLIPEVGIDRTGGHDNIQMNVIVKAAEVLSMDRKTLIILSYFIFLMPLGAYAGAEDQLYRKALAEAKAGRADFAFMYYNQLDREYPHSRYRQEILLAKGEYHYQLPNYKEATQLFQELNRDYPESGGRLFTLAYLYKMAQVAADQTALEEAKKEILSLRQLGLIFKESKEYKYPSPLFGSYRAVFRIDNVEFYRGGELFATVSY